MFEVNIWILISQTINFLVLFYILHRFLFAPISKIIDKRREEIVKTKEETTAEYDEAKRLKTECQQRLDNIKDEMESLRQQKLLETQDQVENVILDAKKQAETLKEEAELEVFMERQKAWVQLRSEVVQLATIAAEKILEESLDDETHRKLISRTIEKLDKELPDKKDQSADPDLLIPTEYAENFFAKIDEKGIKPNYSDFRAFVKIYDENKEFREIVESPTIATEKKLALMKNVFSGNLQEDVSNFIVKLINEKHIHLLGKIADEVGKLYHNRKCIKSIRVRTRIPLTPSEQEQLRNVITKKFGSIEVEEVIDSNLVGGLIIQLENQVIDDSIDARVKQLREMMSKVESAWRQQLADAPSLAMF